ncbi:MAG: hypothetical protein FWE41_01920 [Coriobacteriia bacterium]|nr:hypothetical protein [Coriobacteriia bacterium]MCL2750609.1 hypothetical protein [Coriobacteriia bacterium]
MFQFDLGQIGTLTPSPCSNPKQLSLPSESVSPSPVSQPRPSVPVVYCYTVFPKGSPVCFMCKLKGNRRANDRN